MPVTQCNISKSYNSTTIGMALLDYLNGNQQSLEQIINRSNLDTKVKYKLSTLNSDDEAQNRIKEFNDAFDEALDFIVGNNITTRANANNIKSKVFESLNVELDEHQVDKSSDDTEDTQKDENEVFDTNSANLEEHLAEIYGTSAYAITTALKDKFSESITDSAFFNIVTKQPVLRSNKVLNKNIQTLKAKLFQNIVDFLASKDSDFKKSTMYDANGKLVGNYYFKVLSDFYKYIKSVHNLSDQLVDIQSRKNDRGIRDANTEIYKNIVNELLKNDAFNTRFKRKFTNNLSRKLATTTLYEANNLSGYYFTVLDIAKKAGIKEVIVDGNTYTLENLNFNQEETNILSALNAYTQLTHFDELLRETFGLEIDVKKGRFGLEFGDSDKYEFHKDTTYQKKNWQSSESIESEKYIAKLVDRLLDQVKIYGFRTNEYQNKSATSTSVINAARNLLDDLLFRKINIIQWADSSIKRENNIAKIIQHAFNLHDNAEVHFQQILELLFETDLASKLDITENMAMNQFDMDTLYSLYRTILDRNNPNSLLSQENSNIMAGPISQLSREISALVDRNTPAYYTETSFDELTGQTVVKVKKRYFNNVQVYKQRVAINRLVNNRTSDQSKKLDSKYNFEAITTNKKTDYIAHLPNNITLKYSSENILKAKEKGSFDKSNNDLFKDLNQVNILSFRQKFLKNERLKETEQKLKNVIDFIDSQLNLNIMSSVRLQQLYTFQMLKPTNLQKLTRLAMKAAFVNHLYSEASINKKSLTEYLKEGNKFGIYSIYNENKNSRLFSNQFKNLKINIALYNDETIQNWGDAYSILTGQASKATIKNKEGNATPNNTISKLGTDALYYMNKQKNTNAASLFFVKDNTKIVKIQHDLEASSQWNEDKQVKNFSQRELFYHSLFNKFYGSYISNGTLLIQPTTFSDKTTFLNYEITSELFGEDIIKEPKYQDIIVTQYINTIGTMYKNIFKDWKTKLDTLRSIYNSETGNSYTNNKDFLWNITEAQLVDLAVGNGYNITKDADYRIIKGSDGKSHLAVNEILDYYANYLYANEDNLKDFLQKQKNLFAQELLDTGNIFQVIDYKDKISNYLGNKLPEEIESKNPIIQTIIKVFNTQDTRKEFMSNWIDAKTGRLIIAKANGVNYITNSSIKGDVELNPLLDKFFYIEGFLSNNLRMSLTGSEINHPNKAFNTLFDKVKKAKSKEEYANLGFNEQNYEDVKKILDTVSSVAELRTASSRNVKVKNDIAKIYEDTVTTIANTAQGTQFKRNVIIPATLQYCEQNTITGISPKVKCAVIYDEKSPVFNYRGSHEKSIDSADGSAKINPFQSILENKALGSQSVGFIKKPIWHAYDSNTCTSFLAKFATNTITNKSMLDSMLAHTSLYNLFKKMTNLQWQGDVNLTQNIVTGKILGNNDSKSDLLSTWFNNTILGNIANDTTNKLLYKDKYGDIQQIHGLNFTLVDGKMVYYTLEQAYIKGVSVVHPTPKYHLYTDQHYIFNSVEEVSDFLNEHPEAHTINSLFELHDALGGVYCVDSKGQSSEFNNEVVVNFMNNVGYIKADAESKILNQENYEQPLKKYHIGYALNNTAVKNGAQNINKVNAWYDDTALKYFEVSSAGLGMQMNADHDIINSELTEFSQVITATAAYGYTFDNTNEIFQGLSRASLSSTQILRQSVKKFLNENFDNPEQARSDLYDSIGRIIMVSSSIKDKESLQSIIMEAVNQIFYKSHNHIDDNAKIPFSDPNIYSDFIATLTSTINKEAIKRKHPGSGCVMVPAYNMEQYYEFGGNKYMFDDVLKKAQTEYKNNLMLLLRQQPNYDSKTDKLGDFIIKFASTVDLETEINKLGLENPYKIEVQDIAKYNSTLVTNYLNKLQDNPELVKPKSWFMPTDVVNIVTESGNIRTIALDTMDDYYKFKLGITDIEVAKDVTIDVDFPKNKYVIKDNKGNTCTLTKNGEKWQVDNKTLSAIAALIKGKVILPDDTVVTSEPLVDKLTYIENVTKPRNLRPSTIRWQDAETDEWFNIFDSNVIKSAYLTGTTNQKGVQDELNNIYNGTYTKADGTNGTIKEGSLDNQAAELIMSNIYKDKFDIGSESLSEILEQGEDYFKRKFNRISTPINYDYDLAFIKDTGACTLVTFSAVKPNEFKQLNEFNPEQLYTNQDGEIHLIRGGQPILKVGKWINVDNATYKDGNFYINDKVQDKNKFRLLDANDPTSIQKRIDFVTRYKYIDKKVNKDGNVSYQEDVMYAMAPINDFMEALEGDAASAANQRAAIVAHIYTNDKFKLAQINSSIIDKRRLGEVVSGTKWIQSSAIIPQDVKDLLKSQIEDTNIVKYNGEALTDEQKKKNLEARKENYKKYQDKLKEFLNKETHKRYISFLDSLNFIASRIPAQSLQSFMTMKNIAWTGNNKNMAYVSHFQTYLQGSKNIITCLINK